MWYNNVNPIDDIWIAQDSTEESCAAAALAEAARNAPEAVAKRRIIFSALWNEELSEKNIYVRNIREMLDTHARDAVHGYVDSKMYLPLGLIKDLLGLVGVDALDNFVQLQEKLRQLYEVCRLSKYKKAWSDKTEFGSVEVSKEELYELFEALKTIQ